MLTIKFSGIDETLTFSNDEDEDVDNIWATFKRLEEHYGRKATMNDVVEISCPTSAIQELIDKHSEKWIYRLETFVWKSLALEYYWEIDLEEFSSRYLKEIETGSI